jgi:hypothetical protein
MVLAIAFASGCVPGSVSGPDRVDAVAAISVDGMPVDCTRVTTVATASATTRVVVLPPENVELDVTLDGEDVRDRFGSEWAATLELPVDRVVTLVVERVGIEPWQCRTRLVHRAGAERGLEELSSVSASEVIVTRSQETGSVSSAVVEVPTEGTTPSERARAFLADHADVLAVPAWQLRERDAWSSGDGWTTVVFEQWPGDNVLALESRLEVELDANGVVRTLHANLYPDLTGAPTFVLGPERALSIAESSIGAPEAFQRVVYDRVDPRAGWYVIGPGGTVVIDDERETAAWSAPPYFEVPAEVHYPTPYPLVFMPTGVGASMLVARGDTRTGPPATLSAPEREMWSSVATIVSEMESRTGSSGWPGTIRMVTQNEIAEGTATLPDGRTTRIPGAFYMPGRGTMFLDGAARLREETICHEYGHAFDDARGGSTSGTFAECLGDVFYLFCEPWVNPRGIMYAYNESTRRHDRPFGRTDQFDYDAFRALGIRETAIGRGATIRGVPIGVHDHAFLVTHAFYRMMETHRLDRAKAMQLGFSAAAGSYSTYPELRDRVLSDAVSWARTSRFGFTMADACAVAQGFRYTKLDGEYASGTGCERTSRTELICTSRFCPLCGMTEPPSVCRPETLAAGQPICTTADGRRTCVGSVALSGQGCPSGQGRQCFCVGNERWDCSTAGACRPYANEELYCAEDAGPTVPPSTGPVTCTASARPVTPSLAWLPWLALGLAVLLRRTARARRDNRV